MSDTEFSGIESPEPTQSGSQPAAVSPGVPDAPRRRFRLSRRAAIVFALLIWTGMLVIAGAVVSRTDSCAQCHITQARTLGEGQHGGVECAACHSASGGWGGVATASDTLFRMVPAKALGRDVATRPGVRIARDACEACHAAGLDQPTEANGLRIVHSKCAPSPTRCDQCHGATGHGTSVRWVRTAEMEPCIGCHEESGIATKCDMCHVGRLPEDRITSGPWRVTHGPEWSSTHGMGHLPGCATCHEQEKCVKCHNTPIPHVTGFIATHGKESLGKDAKCLTCHRSKGWCDGCHGMEMPHPDGFLRAHSKRAKSMGDPQCLGCHQSADCTNCHKKHTHPGLPDQLLRELERAAKARP